MPPIQVPLTIEQLDRFHGTSMKDASREWMTVYVSGQKYLEDRSNPKNMLALNDAIDDWRIEKAKPRWVRSSSKMRGLEWIEAFEKDLMDQPTPRTLSIEEQKSLEYWNEERERMLIRVLKNAVIVPKEDYQLARELKALASETVETTDAWLSVAGSDSVQTMAVSTVTGISSVSSAEAALTPFREIINNLFSELEATAKDQATSILISIIGPQLFHELSKCVPYIGTVIEGKELFDTTKKCVKTSKDAYQTRADRRTVRTGDPEAVVTALIEMLDRDVAELTLSVASQATNFGVGVASLVGTGSDSASLISRAVTATAGLLRTIYDFGRDYLEQYRANKILNGDITTLDYRVLTVCPLLGSFIIEVADASYFMGYDITHPLFTSRLGSDRMAKMAINIGNLKRRAVKINREARFQINYNVDKRTGKTTSNVYEHIYSQDKERRILLAREALRSHTHTVGKNLLIMKQIQDFKSKAQAQIELEKQIRLNKAMINLRAHTHAIGRSQLVMKQITDFKNKATEQLKIESRQNLANLVADSIKTYRDQISGVKGIFTHQSQESMAACRFLENLAKQPLDGRFEKTVAWLLDTSYETNYVIEGLAKRLKKTSRFQGLLNDAYCKWIATR